MNSSLRRAARAALKPNAIILGVATCLFGWSLAEAMRPRYGHDLYLGAQYAQYAILCFGLLAAAVGSTTRSALGNLLAAALSGPVAGFPLGRFLTVGFYCDGSFFGSEHIRIWLLEMFSVPASDWLMTALATAILSSAVVATLRPTPSRS